MNDLQMLVPQRRKRLFLLAIEANIKGKFDSKDFDAMLFREWPVLAPPPTLSDWQIPMQLEEEDMATVLWDNETKELYT